MQVRVHISWARKVNGAGGGEASGGKGDLLTLFALLAAFVAVEAVLLAGVHHLAWRTSREKQVIYGAPKSLLLVITGTQVNPELFPKCCWRRLCSVPRPARLRRLSSRTLATHTTAEHFQIFKSQCWFRVFGCGSCLSPSLHTRGTHWLSLSMCPGLQLRHRSAATQAPQSAGQGSQRFPAEWKNPTGQTSRH